MYKVRYYIETDSMGDLISDNYPMLLVISRFGIDLGFGEMSISEVCKQNGVDVDTFLALVNLLVADDKKSVKLDYDKISLPNLITYLHNSHSYFLEYRLPTIREKLLEALSDSEDVSLLIVNYYDEYLLEVNNHMMYEEETLFPYIKAVIEGECTKMYSIDTYSKHHDHVEEKLTELKNIMIKYYPAVATNRLVNVLYEIFSCEIELSSHNSIEDYILVPVMKHIEQLKK